MKLFNDSSDWFKISWLFLKFTWENFVKFFFSHFSQLLLLSSFFNKGNSCEIENSKYFDAMVGMVYFLNIFLYCKIIISFSELFPATCFLCILQTQLTRRNTSIPTKLKKCQHMTFVMTSSNDDKSDICQFFYKNLFHIVSTVQNFM